MRPSTCFTIIFVCTVTFSAVLCEKNYKISQYKDGVDSKKNLKEKYSYNKNEEQRFNKKSKFKSSEEAEEETSDSNKQVCYKKNCDKSRIGGEKRQFDNGGGKYKAKNKLNRHRDSAEEELGNDRAKQKLKYKPNKKMTDNLSKEEIKIGKHKLKKREIVTNDVYNDREDKLRNKNRARKENYEKVRKVESEQDGWKRSNLKKNSKKMVEETDVGTIDSEGNEKGKLKKFLKKNEARKFESDEDSEESGDTEEQDSELIQKIEEDDESLQSSESNTNEDEEVEEEEEEEEEEVIQEDSEEQPHKKKPMTYVKKFAHEKDNQDRENKEEMKSILKIHKKSGRDINDAKKRFKEANEDDSNEENTHPKRMNLAFDEEEE